jgi:glycolate oxidase FAD binding subunit
VTPWAEVVGAEHVSPGGSADAIDGVVPAWVVRPGSVVEVQACMRAAWEAGASVVASGLGAHLDVGAPPMRVDVLLRLARLARAIDHQAGDMTVTVDAGCPLSVLSDALASAGQWLPLDPPAPALTTAGGLIAANLSGPLAASQGTVRDLLLGLRVVGADGALIAGGGRVVKNVAGYDLPKLHVGALGTLGVIVEATFKLRPRPAHEMALLIDCPSPAAATEVALEVLASPVPPLWLELAGAGGFAGEPGVGAALAVGLGGMREEVAEGEAAVEAVARAGGLPVTQGAVGLRACLADFPLAPGAAVLRAGVLPSEVGTVIDALSAAARAADARMRCVARAANGVVRAAVAEPDRVPPIVEAMRPRIEAGGGSLVVERAPPAVKRVLDVWGSPGPGLPLMRGIKSALDPSNRLAPGRFVGGI